jgi:hypothetical protein
MWLKPVREISEIIPAVLNNDFVDAGSNPKYMVALYWCVNGY